MFTGTPPAVVGTIHRAPSATPRRASQASTAFGCADAGNTTMTPARFSVSVLFSGLLFMVVASQDAKASAVAIRFRRGRNFN
jgi:hypothetical protein